MKPALAAEHAPVASSAVHATLRAEILDGRLEGGAPLRQGEIAQRFGVSKIPVREALRQLESEGLVAFRPRRGAIVREISDTEVLELFDVRLALECRALALAVPQMIEQDLRLARDIHAEYAAETDRARWSALNLRFHHALLEPCANGTLLALLADVEERMGAAIRLRVTRVSGLERPLREHSAILDACAAGDGVAAVERLHAHIDTTRKEFVAHRRRSSTSPLEPGLPGPGGRRA
ncbi:MAG: GntR family transcriptional regulator [Pseudomonadota bacterium]